MKKALKRLLCICIAAGLCTGLFFAAKAFLIRNIFDEMYYGTKDIWGGYLTSASWRNAEGIRYIPDIVKYSVPGLIWSGFESAVLEEDEQLSFYWETTEKRLLFQYSIRCTVDEELLSGVTDICYSPRDKVLTVHPLRVVSTENIHGDTSQEAVNAFFDQCGITRDTYDARMEERFRELVIDNWRTGNTESLFRESLGELQIVHSEAGHYDAQPKHP